MQTAPPLCGLSDELYQYGLVSKPQDKEEEEAWLNAFCYCLAPVLVQFVRWALQSAVKDGHKRLYFLARDGYLMYQTAHILCRKLQIPLECRYLHVSRFSLRSAEYALLGQESLDYICLNGMHVTFDRIMQRAGFETAEAERVARQLGIAADNCNRQLSYSQISDIRRQLSENYYFMQKLEEHAKKRYPNVIGYLRQEGLMDDIPYAIVDSGWTGSIQKSLHHLIASQLPAQTQSSVKKRIKEKGIDGYYFGMYEYAKDTKTDLYHTFYFSPLSGGRKKAFFCNNLFECVFSSPEGMTLEYQEKNGRFCPIFSTGENPNQARIKRSEELLNCYAEILCAKGTPASMSVFMPVITRLLSLFMARPIPMEAKAYGSYLFCDDVDGQEILTVASQPDESVFRKNSLIFRLLQYLTGRERPVPFSAWTEGSIMLCEKKHSFRLFQSVLYKYLLFTRKSLKQRRRK